MNPEPESKSNWWHRPCGGKEVMQLALPLIFSSLSWTLLTFIDRMLLLWYSDDSLAASFPAALLWWTCICFPLGICMYVNAFVSQYFGAEEKHQIGPSMWQGVWIAVAASPLVLLISPLAPSIFRFAGHTESVMQEEIDYFRILCFGAGGMLISFAMSSFYSGQGKTVVVMVVDAISALINIVLDYLWIFGVAGFPEAGIVGAGWATVIALWAKVAIYLVLILRQHNRQVFATTTFQLNRTLMRRLLVYGGPSGLQMFLEVLGFSTFVLLVGRLGRNELAATNLAFNVSTLAFMPVFGISTAATIMVGQQLGRNQPQLAARATWTTAGLSCVYMGVISILYLFAPDLFLYGFVAGSQSENREVIRQAAIVLLRFVAAYNIFDALNLVFVGALKGAGDTRFIFIVSLAMAILLATSTWISLEVLQLDLYGCWTVVTVWVSLLGAIYLLRFVQGKWRKMRVIEMHTSTEAPVSVAPDSGTIETATPVTCD